MNRNIGKDKIRGVNLGNWLVLEKWMDVELFEGIPAEDETWFNRDLPKEEAERRLKEHRETYVTKKDFEWIAERGLNTVRIPVPYFIFGDREPYSGCIEYLDRAFDWAEETGLKILIDLHTSPGNQNGYDNGGLVGVCKWAQMPEEVEFVLTVLERLAERYADRKALFGIEALNEPTSLAVWLTSPTTGKERDKEEAKGSGPISIKFLKKFYRDAYTRMRKHLSTDKAIVFHDGFRIDVWRDFFVKSGMKNVYLDAHFYVSAMETFVPVHNMLSYRAYIAMERARIKMAARYTPVIIGEWCISVSYGNKIKGNMDKKERSRIRRERFRKLALLEISSWETSAGWLYWNYKLGRDVNVPMDEDWKTAWDFRRCVKYGWMPDKYGNKA